MLPEKSWRFIMSGLDNHFGEDASLSEPVRQEVLAYHLAHASNVDTHRRAQKFLAGVDPDNPPMKVTETARFLDKHDDVPDAAFTQKAVRSKANCPACHPGAEQGYYEEEDETEHEKDDDDDDDDDDGDD